MEVGVLPIYMEVGNSRAYIDQLYSNDPQMCFHAVSELKYTVIGSLREKGSIIEQGVVARLLQILKAPDSDILLKTEITIVLNSLAKGLPDHAAALVQAGLLPVLWEQLEICGGSPSNGSYTKMVLCCLRSVYLQGCAPPPPSWNHRLLNTLIQYGYSPPSNQECVANILASACRSGEQQQQLVDAGGGDLVASMLNSGLRSVQLPALHCLSSLALNNDKVCGVLAQKYFAGKSVPDLLVNLMARDKPHRMQLAAAGCLSFLHRGKAVAADDPRIRFKTLQCLVRLCREDCGIWVRIEAAHLLAYLTEINIDLQRIAAMTDHLIKQMTDFLNYTLDSKPQIPSDDEVLPVANCGRVYNDPKLWPDMMKDAALRVYASLAANDEEIRKKVIETNGLMKIILSLLKNGTYGSMAQMSAVRCLHSLSRSVQTLRTTFTDQSVWQPLMCLLRHESADEEMITLTSSILCNLLLEFSPSKKSILEEGIIAFLCSMTRKSHPGHRLNGVWALMNISFQSDYKTKECIMTHLGTDQLFRLLSDSEVNILMKTLGMLRNMLCTKLHIDNLMETHGKQIMQAVVLILEGDHSVEVKEQALCILSNMSDGNKAKTAIMSNEDVLKKLMNYMVMTDVKLQMASSLCILNLMRNCHLGAPERQVKFKLMGLDKLLHTLLSTADPGLFDIVKETLDIFKKQEESASLNWREIQLLQPEHQ